MSLHSNDSTDSESINMLLMTDLETYYRSVTDSNNTTGNRRSASSSTLRSPDGDQSTIQFNDQSNPVSAGLQSSLNVAASSGFNHIALPSQHPLTVNGDISNSFGFATNSREPSGTVQQMINSPALPRNVPADFQPQRQNDMVSSQVNPDSIIYPEFIPNSNETNSARRRADSAYSSNSFSTVFSTSQTNLQAYASPHSVSSPQSRYLNPYSPSTNALSPSLDSQAPYQSMQQSSSMNFSNFLSNSNDMMPSRQSLLTSSGGTRSPSLGMQSQYQNMMQSGGMSNPSVNYSGYMSNSRESALPIPPRRSPATRPANMQREFQPQLHSAQISSPVNNDSIIYPEFMLNSNDASSVRRRADSVYSNNSYSTGYSNPSTNAQPSFSSSAAEHPSQQQQTYANRIPRHSSVTVNNQPVYRPSNVVMSQSSMFVEGRSPQIISWTDSLKRFVHESYDPNTVAKSMRKVNVKKHKDISHDIFTRTAQPPSPKQFVTIEEDMEELIEEDHQSPSEFIIEVDNLWDFKPQDIGCDGYCRSVSDCSLQLLLTASSFLFMKRGEMIKEGEIENIQKRFKSYSFESSQMFSVFKSGFFPEELEPMLPQTDHDERSIVHLLVLDARDTLEVVRFYEMFLRRQSVYLNETEESEQLLRKYPSLESNSNGPQKPQLTSSSHYKPWYPIFTTLPNRESNIEVLRTIGSFVESHKSYFCNSSLHRYYYSNRAYLPLHELFSMPSVGKGIETDQDSTDVPKTIKWLRFKELEMTKTLISQGMLLQSASLGILHTPVSTTGNFESIDYSRLSGWLSVRSEPYRSRELRYRVSQQYIVSLLDEFWTTPIQRLLRSYEKKTYSVGNADMRSFVDLIVNNNMKNEILSRVMTSEVYKTSCSGLSLHQMTERLIRFNSSSTQQVVNNRLHFYIHVLKTQDFVDKYILQLQLAPSYSNNTIDWRTALTIPFPGMGDVCNVLTSLLRFTSDMYNGSSELSPSFKELTSGHLFIFQENQVLYMEDGEKKEVFVLRLPTAQTDAEKTTYGISLTNKNTYMLPSASTGLPPSFSPPSLNMTRGRGRRRTQSNGNENQTKKRKTKEAAPHPGATPMPRRPINISQASVNYTYSGRIPQGQQAMGSRLPPPSPYQQPISNNQRMMLYQGMNQMIGSMGTDRNTNKKVVYPVRNAMTQDRQMYQQKVDTQNRYSQTPGRTIYV